MLYKFSFFCVFIKNHKNTVKLESIHPIFTLIFTSLYFFIFPTPFQQILIHSPSNSTSSTSPAFHSTTNPHKNLPSHQPYPPYPLHALNPPFNRNTALTLACFQGRTEVVRLLLQFGANFEHRAKTGLTPLMEAANGGFAEVGSLLLKSKADPNAPASGLRQETPHLQLRQTRDTPRSCPCWLHEGAAVDVKNKKGCTPLFLACSNGHLETVKILVANGADVDALDNRKTSPLVAAFRKGFVKVCVRRVKGGGWTVCLFVEVE